MSLAKSSLFKSPAHVHYPEVKPYPSTCPINLALFLGRNPEPSGRPWRMPQVQQYRPLCFVVFRMRSCYGRSSCAFLQNYILRCRAICHAWHRATSNPNFLLAHHHCQPSLPIISSSEYSGTHHVSIVKNILVFDHRAAEAELQPVARLKDYFCQASCDGILILYNRCMTGSSNSVCNLATRQHAPLRQLLGFSFLGIYAHRPTGEYRLLLHWNLHPEREDPTGFYVLALGSDQPPRYIGALEDAGSRHLHSSTLVRDSLHWYPLDPLYYPSDPQQYKIGSKVVIVFDTMSELFRQMRAPDVPARSYIFEMDATLGIHSYKADTGIVNVWVLQNYKDEVWERLYNIKLPVAEIKEQFGWLDEDAWDVNVVSLHGDVLLLAVQGRWMVYIDVDSELVAKFHRDRQHFNSWELRLKQTLVQHTFFHAL